MSKESKPFVEVVCDFSSTTRNPTPKEMHDADLWKIAAGELNLSIPKLEKALVMLKAELNKCPHTVRVDSEGCPFDAMSCYSCGKHLGNI